MLTRPALLALTPVLALVGCVSAVDQHALQGIDALDRCDLRTAHTEFAAARDLDTDRSDVALAYALTDLATLVEDPALAPLAPRLGFDRAIDSSLAWGHDGLLDRLSRNESCDTLTTWYHDTFPHPSARVGGPDFVSTLDPTLTLGDVRAALVALTPRLTADARALELAARHLDTSGVTISGGCGLSARPTRLQAPELLALAAALDTLVAAVEILRGYDGSIPVQLLLRGSYQHETEWTAAMNAGFFHPTDPATIAAGRVALTEAIDLALQAVTAARDARAMEHPSDAIFDWTAVPTYVLDDVEAFGQAAEEGLVTDGMHAIPRLSPALSIDVSSFFTTPFDGTAAGPLWSVQNDEFSTWVSFDGERMQGLLAPRFSSDPWATNAPSRSFSVDWNSTPSATWEQMFDPGHRWTGAYACESP